MKTICMQIGNSDDKLTQAEWHKFVSITLDLVEDKSEEIHFFEASFGWAKWQNACWVFNIKDENVSFLKEAMTILRQTFQQDSVAWLEGNVEFV